jgi:hypothetical protein
MFAHFLSKWPKTLENVFFLAINLPKTRFFNKKWPFLNCGIFDTFLVVKYDLDWGSIFPLNFLITNILQICVFCRQKQLFLRYRGLID